MPRPPTSPPWLTTRFSKRAPTDALDHRGAGIFPPWLQMAEILLSSITVHITYCESLWDAFIVVSLRMRYDHNVKLSNFRRSRLYPEARLDTLLECSYAS
jgi:hypothetical protein